MDPDAETIRSAAADSAAVLLNLPPAGVGAPVPAVRGGIVSRRALFQLLGRAGRVTQVSAPPGSGKTFLLRSWIGAAGPGCSNRLVSRLGGERHPHRALGSGLNVLP